MEGATPLTPGLLFASHANFLPIYPHVSYWQQVTDRVLQAQPRSDGLAFCPENPGQSSIDGAGLRCRYVCEQPGVRAWPPCIAIGTAGLVYMTDRPAFRPVAGASSPTGPSMMYGGQSHRGYRTGMPPRCAEDARRRRHGAVGLERVRPRAHDAAPVSNETRRSHPATGGA
jgi:hypothetical protein